MFSIVLTTATKVKVVDCESPLWKWVFFPLELNMAMLLAIHEQLIWTTSQQLRKIITELNRIHFSQVSSTGGTFITSHNSVAFQSFHNSADCQWWLVIFDLDGLSLWWVWVFWVNSCPHQRPYENSGEWYQTNANEWELTSHSSR